MGFARGPVVATILALAVIGAAVLALSGQGESPDAEPTAGPTMHAVVDTPADATIIATLDRDVPRHAEPGAAADGTLSAQWHGRPLSVPVIEQEPGWLHVRVPERPNGSTTWVRREDVSLATTAYRIEIDVSAMRLRLFEAGDVVLDVPAGVGTDEAPTPTGEYFVAFLQEPPDSRDWGPFVVVTSAHSETISDYQQSGDAITAIHGPLGAADQIGTQGAQVSKGCVRLHLADLARLREVPPGSPIDIVGPGTRAMGDA